MTRKPTRTHRRKMLARIDTRLFEATVQDLASDGRGVVKHPDGRTFFVAGAWLGERVQVRPTGQQGKVAFGELAAVMDPAEARLSPACVHHGYSDGDCGGCPWMMVDYSAQLAAKQQRVAQTLARLGAIAALQPALGAPQPLGYRNRAQFKTDGQRLGYVSARSNHLVPITDCAVLSDTNRLTLRDLLRDLPREAWQPKRREPWVTIDIDDQSGAVQIDQRLPFRQGNTEQNRVMRDWLASQCAPYDRDIPVLELFCGSGNFTEVLVDAGFKHIAAVEGAEASLADLAAQNWPQVTPLAVNLFDETAVETLAQQHKNTRLLVLDPPRDGLKVRVPLLKKLRALETVLYVACDLATWARDVADFQRAGFNVESVTPIDLFPQTPHVELLSKLVRAKK